MGVQIFRMPSQQSVDLRKKLDMEGQRLSRKKVEVIPQINAMMAKGLINPEATGRMDDPETLDQFIRLFNIGAPEEVILQVLNLNKNKYNFLLRKYQEMCVEGILELGPLGVLGTAYHRLHELSQKALSIVAQLDSKDSAGRKEVLELMRFVKDTEAEKVRMMVTTGAVANRKKVPLHPHFSKSSADSKVPSVERVMGLISAVLDSEEEAIEAELVGLGDGSSIEQS